MRAVLAWLLWMLFAFAASLPGAAWPPGDWYESLAKPAWTPPGWAVPVVWTTLYALMGTAAWLVWRRPKATPGRRIALTAFVVQLALNAAWTPVFFGMHAMLAALGVIVALWLAILATLLAFRRVSLTAAGLLVPYLVWVTLATALNFEIYRLNG
jgi:tryptophan-rich sensory protein